MSQPTPPLGDFLRARRSRLSPTAVGLPAQGNRKVPGLRREEVAGMAGISSQYYLRLEQGRDRQPSPQIIRSLAEALRLGQDGMSYMARLVAREGTSNVSGVTYPRRDPALTLTSYTTQAAFVSDSNFDILAANDIALRLSAGEWSTGSNLVSSFFGDRMRAAIEDWEDGARSVVAALRFRADPYDRRLHALVGGLAVRDADFRRIWARHEAHASYVQHSTQRVPGLGAIDLVTYTFRVPDTPGWMLAAVIPDGASKTSTARFADLAAGGSTHEPSEDVA